MLAARRTKLGEAGAPQFGRLHGLSHRVIPLSQFCHSFVTPLSHLCLTAFMPINTTRHKRPTAEGHATRQTQTGTACRSAVHYARRCCTTQLGPSRSRGFGRGSGCRLPGYALASDSGGAYAPTATLCRCTRARCRAAPWRPTTRRNGARRAAAVATRYTARSAGEARACWRVGAAVRRAIHELNAWLVPEAHRWRAAVPLQSLHARHQTTGALKLRPQT